MPTTTTRPQISLWGASGVGKTSYLAGSLLAVEKFHSPQWKLRSGGTPEEEKATNEFFNFEMTKLVQGITPEATVMAPPNKYVFQFIQQGNFWGTNGRYHEITMVDAAGVLTEIKVGEDDKGYFAELCQSQGILMLIDPELREENNTLFASQNATMTYYELVTRMLQHLKEAHPDKLTLDIPLAMCLTKIDQPVHWIYRDRPEVYLREILGDIPFNKITSAFKNVSYFAVSVAGLYQEPVTGEWIPNIDPNIDKIIDIKYWQPYKVLDPLSWLFDHLETQKNHRLTWWRRLLRKKLREANLKS